MNRPPLANISDNLIEYILYLEKEILELKTENSKLKRETLLEKIKTSVDKKDFPPGSTGHNYPVIGIIVHK